MRPHWTRNPRVVTYTSNNSCAPAQYRRVVCRPWPLHLCNDVLMTTQNPIRSLGERSSLFLISHKGGVILKNVFLFIPSDQPRVNCLINQPTGKLEICQVNQGIHPTVTIEEKLVRSEEHTSELKSLMRKSYAVFCLKKKKETKTKKN